MRAIPTGEENLGRTPSMASEPGLGCCSVAGEGKEKEKKRKNKKKERGARVRVTRISSGATVGRRSTGHGSAGRAGRTRPPLVGGWSGPRSRRRRGLGERGSPPPPGERPRREAPLRHSTAARSPNGERARRRGPRAAPPARSLRRRSGARSRRCGAQRERERRQMS
jgi:hypothetical protein